MINTQVKYRPRSVKEFVFANSTLESKIAQYTSGNTMTPLVLHGPHGTGKSLLAELIPKAIDGEGVKVTKVTGEDLNTKKEVRSTFTRSATFDRLFEVNGQSRSYTIVEEVNFETKAKGALRVAMDEMEGRDLLIFTTNELDKMDTGLQSRANKVEVVAAPPKAFLGRAKFILAQEGVLVAPELLLEVLESVYDRYQDNREYYKALDEIIYRSMACN